MIDEIKENVRRDRKQLIGLQEQLLSLTKTPASEESEGGTNGFALAVAEGVAKLAESLNRANSQLIEVAKLQARAEGPPGVGGFTDQERKAIFSKIEEESRRMPDREPDA